MLELTRNDAIRIIQSLRLPETVTSDQTFRVTSSLASVLSDPPKEIEAAYSWAAADDTVDALVLASDRLVHVHDAGAGVEATVRLLHNLTAVTATDIIDMEDFASYRWRVGSWKLSFGDGFTLTASTASNFDADRLTEFAQVLQTRVK